MQLIKMEKRKLTLFLRSLKLAIVYKKIVTLREISAFSTVFLAVNFRQFLKNRNVNASGTVDRHLEAKKARLRGQTFSFSKLKGRRQYSKYVPLVSHCNGPLTNDLKNTRP